MTKRKDGTRETDSADRPRAQGAHPFRWMALLLVVTFLAAAARTAQALPARIRIGDTCVGSLDGGQESFPFWAASGTNLRVSLATGGGLLADVIVFGPDGNAVQGTTTVSSMGNLVVFDGWLAATGDHTLVIESQDGTTGTYSLGTTGRPPARLAFTGSALGGDEQWLEFDAFAGTTVSSIVVRRVDRTLVLDRAGTLVDPEGVPVPLGTQRATGKSLGAKRATLASDGTYRFRFTPGGSGAWTATVRLAGPKTEGQTLQVPQGTIRFSRSGSGVRIGVSTPPNGTNFVAGDAPWVAVVLNDDAGTELAASQLATCNLYLYGPQDPMRTVTASGLLRAGTDRTKTPHHYVDLLKNPDVRRYANVLLYPLGAVGTEDPGTYTAAAWARLAADNLQQWFPVADLQVGTATAETHVVEKEKCASCHFGPVAGKFYLHHVDPGYSPTGNWSIDSWPTRTCKACHNNDGYAAYDNRTGSGNANVDRTPDPIVRRVHGVHMGEGTPVPLDSSNNPIPGVGFEGLQNPFDTDPVTGDFRNYTAVVFPADVRRCDRCHVDDRWKTAPSRSACGACHDAIWFGDPGQTPAGMTNHSGLQQGTDANCLICHDDGTIAPIAEKHGVAPAAPWVLDTVDLAMTPPVNGAYYTADDDVLGATVTVTIRNDSGAPIDHTLVTDANFGAANLFLYGPRSRSVPVLSNAAVYGDAKKRASVTCNTAATGSPAVWAFGATDTFKMAINGGAPFTLTVPGTTATPSQIVAWLNTYFNANGIQAVAAVSSTTKVKIDSKIQNWQGTSRIDIYNGPVTTIMGWKPPVANPGTAGTTMEPYVKVGAGTYSNNDLRQILAPNPLDWYDPDVVRTTPAITYTLRGKFRDLAPGTYFAYFYCNPTPGKVAGMANRSATGFLTFQVGTATVEKKIATNCSDCHFDGIMHLYERNIHPAQFNPDQCKACHDYGHYATGDAFVNQGGTSTSGWSGFGAVPIARRVHGVHRGAYLEHPEEIYSNANPFAEVVFPQDIRNCTKCHSESDSWKEKPSRVACLACHDTDSAKAHGATMSFLANLADPYGTGALESCAVCHGEGAEFAVSKVHSLSNPYVPPYPREEE